MASTFGRGAPLGMKIDDRRPARLAARATPWAWLPAEAATTRAPSSGRAATWVYAPRILNEPVRCRCSGLSSTGAPGHPAQRVGLLDRRRPSGSRPGPLGAARMRLDPAPAVDLGCHRDGGYAGPSPLPAPRGTCRLHHTGTSARTSTRAHLHPQSLRDRARLVRRRRRGRGAGPHGHRGRPRPAGQAQADLHARTSTPATT